MQPSKSCQAALTPVYDWSKAHQSSASGCFAFMRKRGKSISPQQWWPTACAASWFWAPSLNPGCCTQPCPHLGRAEQLLLFLPVLPNKSVAVGVLAHELKGGWESREVWPFDCCRCFCQYCAFADLVSSSMTNFPLCYFKLTLFGGFVWLIRSVLL